MSLGQMKLFEGLEPSALTFSISGKITEPLDQPAHELKLGDTVVTVTVGKVDHVGFDDADPGPVRAQKVKIEQAFSVPADEATELLARLYRDNRRAAESLGLVPLEPDDEESSTTKSGIDTVTISGGGKSVTTTPEAIKRAATDLAGSRR